MGFLQDNWKISALIAESTILSGWFLNLGLYDPKHFNLYKSHHISRRVQAVCVWTQGPFCLEAVVLYRWWPFEEGLVDPSCEIRNKGCSSPLSQGSRYCLPDPAGGHHLEEAPAQDARILKLRKGRQGWRIWIWAMQANECSCKAYSNS